MTRPDRTSLYRAFHILERTGFLRVEHYGGGRVPTVYRRVATGRSDIPSAG